MSTLVKPFTWFYREFGINAVHNTGRNAYLIILARTCRMFAYGTNSLILAIFFSALDFSDHRIGLFMTLTLFGDLLLGTFLTLVADRVGRRKVLLAGSVMMIASGLIFALFENYWILLLAAIIGVISITGGDFGPFRSIEESILSQLTTTSTRADVLAWYVTTSTLGSSIGTEASGRIIRLLQGRQWSDVEAYHALFWVYTFMGIVNVLLVLLLTQDCEMRPTQTYAQIPQDEHEQVNVAEQQPSSNLNAAAPVNPTSFVTRARTWLTGNLSQISAPTRSIMYKLWLLLAVDSLADGMVPYSLTNYYMDIKFHPSKSTLGDVTSISYFLGAIGSSFAGPLARRIGLINTMVFTHVPSSAAVFVFPFAPVFWATAALLLLRTGLNPMDQAPRSAFIAAVVKSEETTAVMGITSMLRTLASMAGPTLTGVLAADDKFWVAFVAAGTFRLAYDFGLFAMFARMKIDKDDSKPNGPARTSQDFEEFELESPRFSVDSSSTDENEHKDRTSQRGMDDALKLPADTGRLRSRSPHRSVDH
ncbi:hypothetical protein PMZ80_005641 [Knufia obscura]|uniref:Major facilitator superfamily (MFS) profile domain-containing protein n=1 Tax=Knufia obscura TaxID=1635080 RepID=A0ABR0RM71_9EURO|nr:hypothetical protein PMZ80_005641 [Knufia obscura]